MIFFFSFCYKWFNYNFLQNGSWTILFNGKFCATVIKHMRPPLVSSLFFVSLFSFLALICLYLEFLSFVKFKFRSYFSSYWVLSKPDFFCYILSFEFHHNFSLWVTNIGSNNKNNLLHDRTFFVFVTRAVTQEFGLTPF